MVNEVIRQDGTYQGTSGNDSFRIVDGVEIRIDGGDGTDTLNLGTVENVGEHVVFGQTVRGPKRILTISNFENIIGSSGVDKFVADDKDNKLRGYGGDDFIEGKDGDDLITGGQDDDHLDGGRGDDTLKGGFGNDRIYGRAGDDILEGGSGTDSLYGGPGDDTLIADGAPGNYEKPFKMPNGVNSTKNASRRDVAMIVVDDMAPWVPFIDSRTTINRNLIPNLNRIITESAVFSNAYSNSSLCSPSRASFLSGMYPYETGVTGSLNDRNDNVPDDFMIERFFKNQGFHVTEYGKVRNHSERYNIGLNRFFFDPIQVRQTGGAPYGVLEPADRGEMDRLFVDAKVATMAVNALKSDESSNKHHAYFFGITRPHSPFFVPKEYLDWVNDNITDTDLRNFTRRLGYDLGEEPQGWIETISQYTKEELFLGIDFGSWEEMAIVFRHYLASIRFADAMIGEIYDAIKQYRPTAMISIFSDHGYHMYDHGKGTSKATNWPQSIRTPLIFNGPDIAAMVHDEVVSLIDVYGTYTDATGLVTPNHVQGRSLWPILTNQASVNEWDNTILAVIGDQYSIGRNLDRSFVSFAVVNNMYHYIRNDDGSQELYDIASDPDGYRNLVATEQGLLSHKDIICEMSAYLPRYPDYLYGSTGSDKYVIGGGGYTFVYDSHSYRGDVDVIEFPNLDMEDVSYSEVSISKKGGDKTLRITTPNGTVDVYNHYGSSFNSVEKIVFKNGEKSLISKKNGI